MSTAVKTLRLLRFPAVTNNSRTKVAAKIATTFGLVTAGDATCQFYVEKAKKWDHMRSFRQAFVGSCLICPSNLFYLSKIAPHVSSRLSSFKFMRDGKMSLNCLFGGLIQFLIMGSIQATTIAFMSGFLKHRHVDKGIQAW